MQKVSYTGDGSTTEFTFNFPYYENTNIIVTKNNQTATGYTIIGTSGGLDADIPYTGGKVVFDTAPTILDTITIARYLPRTRSVDYQPLAKIDPTTLNQDMNYMMEVLKDMQDDLMTFQTQYESIVNKQETTQLLNKIDNVTEEMEDTNQNIEDFYQAVEDRHIMSTDMFYAHAANCITEIPQNITLTLASGTLTLKKGSKCYLKTDTTAPSVSVDADLTTTQTTDGTYFAIYNGASLTTVLTSAYTYATLPDTYSLPLAVVTVSGGAISAINQVFNGFGYIGSTIFMLPGVKGLKPNGRNADGTLRNVNFTISAVKTNSTSRPSTHGYLIYSPAGDGTVQKSAAATNWTYDKTTNFTYSSGGDTNWMFWGEYTTDASDLITSFSPKTALHIQDASDTEYIAHQAMPSNKYIDLTLGSDGSTYTAPADGYFTISKESTAAGQRVGFVVNNGITVLNYAAASGESVATFIPVQKGQQLTVRYSTAGTTNCFRFIFANGAK